MPLRMSGIVPRWPTLPVIALSAIGTVQDGFVWARLPVFVNKKLRCLMRCCWLCNQPDFGRYALQFRPRIPLHREQWQSIILFNSAHHRQHSLHRQRTRLDKIRLH